jgi:hypothetical protein
VPSTLSEEALRGAFGAFGPVKDVYFPRNQTTGERRPFCFITFMRAADAQRAVAESSCMVGGVKVGPLTLAEDREEHYGQLRSRAVAPAAPVFAASYAPHPPAVFPGGAIAGMPPLGAPAFQAQAQMLHHPGALIMAPSMGGYDFSTAISAAMAGGFGPLPTPGSGYPAAAYNTYSAAPGAYVQVGGMPGYAPASPFGYAGGMSAGGGPQRHSSGERSRSGGRGNGRTH